MNPGDLTSQVYLQAKSATTDAGGGRVEVWADSGAAFWAAIEPLEGNEAARAMQQGYSQPHRIRAWYRTGVTHKHRIRFGARYFKIASVVDVKLRHAELEILADEVSP